jgi:protoporphyrin/coproporphyrin ferrochelatase
MTGRLRPASAGQGVLLMAHGTPSSLDEMPEYLTRVRGGRPPSPELVAEMRHNYAAIGGRSPLTELTLLQARALQLRLGSDIPVAVGMRNWQPSIDDAVAQLVSAGVRRIVGIPLAPQFSTMSVSKYYESAAAAIPAGVTLERVDSYHSHPLLLQAFAERIVEAQPQDGEVVIFTAHSVPERVIATGDRYAHEVDETARGVAARAGVASYSRAFQSAGRTPEPWIGPDLGHEIRECAAHGATRLLIVPIGFVCDHTEILFDIDIQAVAIATECGAALRRTASLNDSPTFIALLEQLVRSMS